MARSSALVVDGASPLVTAPSGPVGDTPAAANASGSPVATHNRPLLWIGPRRVRVRYTPTSACASRCLRQSVVRSPVKALTDIDTQTRTEAASRYVRLRRRYWRCFLGGAAFFAIFGTPLLVFGNHMNPIARCVLGSMLGIGSIACWVGGLATWFALVGFRCPQCGKQFVMSWTSSWPTNRCKHCGLDLAPAAMATE